MTTICPHCEHVHEPQAPPEDDVQACHACGHPMRLLGRYRLTRALGQGGSGAAFEAADDQGGPPCAIKLLRFERVQDWKTVELFERQFSLLRALDHPGVPKVYELFEITQGPLNRRALRQEFVPGHSLKALLATGQLRLDQARAVELLGALLTILEHLHTRSPPILHRDIKPSNIILRPEGQPVLIDFDAATGHGDGLGAWSAGDQTMVGTAGFVPMEQLAGLARPASDLYALGMTMIAALTLREVTSLPVHAMRVQFEPLVPTLHPALVSILRDMIEPDVDRRPQHARQVLERLDAISSARQGALERLRTAPSPGAASASPTPSLHDPSGARHRPDPSPDPSPGPSPGPSPDPSPDHSPLHQRLARGYDGQDVGRATRTTERAPGLALLNQDLASWALDAHASSSYGGSWDVQQITGPLDVFPRYGDLAGAWAPKHTDAGVVWVELSFPERRPQAHALWVFETYNPGAVFAATALIQGQWRLVWQQAPASLPERAHTLQIELAPEQDASRWRLWLQTRAVSGYNEIDAVALISSPQARERFLASQPPPLVGQPFDVTAREPVGLGQRLRPEQVRHLDWSDPRFTWARHAHASSNYGGSWDVSCATGSPRVFPRHGDIPGAWAQRAEARSAQEWLRLSFPYAIDAVEIWILETYHPGAVFAVTTLEAGHEVTLWRDAPQPIADASRALQITLQAPRRLHQVTLWLDRRKSPSYNEIDAVALVGLPAQDSPRQLGQRPGWAPEAAGPGAQAEPAPTALAARPDDAATLATRSTTRRPVQLVTLVLASSLLAFVLAMIFSALLR